MLKVGLATKPCPIIYLKKVLMFKFKFTVRKEIGLNGLNTYFLRMQNELESILFAP